MGPQVHHDTVAAAVFRIIDRDGVAAATLPCVAREADLPSEEVRQYFSDAKELLVFVREVVYTRLSQRLDHHTPAIIDTDPSLTRDERRAALENSLAQFLPLDEERRRDAKVWLACSVHATDQPELEPEIHFFPQSMRKGFPEAFAAAQEAGVVAEDLDTAVETERLAALLDGLTLNGLLHPEIMPPEAMLAVLRRHLDSLRPADSG
ncbi:hypothetical protein GCM10009799_14410 [Nocardiopsis rhodophaea]|uniref:BetI-type transcriptional repressor C-terminal domain-containing protein n=1 Tax=Nocardiopsis rhodophaea TaxID=280238 RepID=A0ABN2SPP2_9ACTN